MTGYVLALALGPVQGFIAAARKTRDLWFGSVMLGEASRAAALALRDAGADLVFPAPSALHPDRAAAGRAGLIPVANKIVAVLAEGADPAALSDAARAAAEGYLRAQRDRAVEVLRQRGLTAAVDRPLLDVQLAQLLEWYAAWWPYDGSPAAYDAARREADALLAGRKALRDFAPAPRPASKSAGDRHLMMMSALDGGRVSVMRARRTAGLTRLGIKDGEHLDGVSLVKRLAPVKDNRRFVSVSRIAIDPLLRALAAHPHMAGLQALAAELAATPLVDTIPVGDGELPQFAAFPFDTDLLLAGDVPLSDEDTAALDERQQRAAAEFRALFTAMARDAGAGEPPAYLAVLVADGDRVGQALAGLTSAEAHRAFSAAGSKFALTAWGMVAAHHGALVYSGGDDVLALLPLDTALDCAAALHRLFGETMGALGLATPPTLSVGLAIGHAMENLQNLLAWGRAAEARAKRTRNTLAVSLHTRSAGASAVAVARSWAGDPLAHWRRWITWFAHDDLPDGAAYELRALVHELRALADTGYAVDELAEREAARILRRKKGGAGTRAVAGSEVETTLLDLLRPPRGPGSGAGLEGGVHAGTLDRLAAIVDELIVARHLARVERFAPPDLEAAGRQTTRLDPRPRQQEEVSHAR